MIWHIAFAVDDLEHAMERFGSALNLQWLPVKSFTGNSVDANNEPYVLSTRLTFAAAGPCALELFERVPGTPNEPAEGTAFHHMGFWTGDITPEASRMEACGWHHAGGSIDTGSRSAFFAGSLGIVLEACNSTIERAGLAKYYPEVAPGMRQPDQFL